MAQPSAATAGSTAVRTASSCVSVVLTYLPSQEKTWASGPRALPTDFPAGYAGCGEHSSAIPRPARPDKPDILPGGSGLEHLLELRRCDDVELRERALV